MIKKIFALFLLFHALTLPAQIIYADYSDPDVCEGTDGDYWLTASSFQCTPGLPLLHSTDLVHWEVVNYAVERLLPASHYNSVQHGCGVWAPSIRRHDGTYYIYWGDPDFGVFMVKSDNPCGRWSEPVLVVEGRGLIDPCPLWDDDGRCYLVNGWAASRCGFNSVLTVRELSADGSRAVGKPLLVYDGQTEGNHTIEGPKFYKRDGFYYILAPAGGVEKGWQVALRSRSIYGPYESRTVFHGDGIHQGGWVADRFIAFQDKGPYGRILHLLDVEWRDGWPVMKESKSDRAERAARKSPIRLQYQWHANRQDSFGFETPCGARIYGHAVSSAFRNLWEVPNLYLRKFEGETFTDTLHLTVTATDEGQQSGFVVMGRDYCRLSAELQGDAFVLKYITCRDADRGGAEESAVVGHVRARSYNAGAKNNYECRLIVRLQCDKGALCRLSYSTDGCRFTPLAVPFQAREGKWIGAKYGVFSITRDAKSRGWAELTDTAAQESGSGFDAARQLSYCSSQVDRALAALCPCDFTMMPRNILGDGRTWNCRRAGAEEWCSGFWPGILWMDYAYTHSEAVKEAAAGYTDAVTPIISSPVFDHDLGFIAISTFLKGYEATGDGRYRRLALQAADSLATLFNDRVGTILSWPRHVKDYGGHNTIIDNMMNLELLYWAAANGGSPRLKEIATCHAETTMNHHFRKDGSSCHVAVYDTLTGKFIRGVTHQGFADSSMWSRGQSWAIYGYTTAYRYTHDKRFLNHARKVADVYLKRLRETSDDWVPVWDMDAPPGSTKDASAACVTASALLELCRYVKDGSRYRDAAIQMLRDLSTERYQSRSRNVSFLMHSTGHYPAGSEIDAGIIYADYYYLEALLRAR